MLGHVAGPQKKREVLKLGKRGECHVGWTANEKVGRIGQGN